MAGGAAECIITGSLVDITKGPAMQTPRMATFPLQLGEKGGKVESRKKVKWRKKENRLSSVLGSHSTSPALFAVQGVVWLLPEICKIGRASCRERV